LKKYTVSAKELFERLFLKIIQSFYFLNTEVELHGTPDYGGWYVAPLSGKEEEVVYAFGVGEDASFEQSIIEKYNPRVYAFDPTPKSIQYVKDKEWPQNFNFIPVGLADFNGTARFYAPENPAHVSHSIIARHGTESNYIEVEMRRLADLARELGHTKIDILKMDIEGSEYSVLDDILRKDYPLQVDQILVEFHHFFDEVEQSDTRRAIIKLLRNGYRIIYRAKSGKEYCFKKVK
jgi:FkbM family methyltransferase